MNWEDIKYMWGSLLLGAVTGCGIIAIVLLYMSYHNLNNDYKDLLEQYRDLKGQVEVLEKLQDTIMHLELMEGS